MLPPASSEYGRLLRGYNDLVDALGEREALAIRLAQRERESVLGGSPRLWRMRCTIRSAGYPRRSIRCANLATILVSGVKAST